MVVSWHLSCKSSGWWWIPKILSSPICNWVSDINQWTTSFCLVPVSVGGLAMISRSFCPKLHVRNPYEPSWWLSTCFIFPSIWDGWLMFFFHRGETTNQILRVDGWQGLTKPFLLFSGLPSCRLDSPGRLGSQTTLAGEYIGGGANATFWCSTDTMTTGIAMVLMQWLTS